MYPLQHFFHRLLLIILSLGITFLVLGGFFYLYLDNQLGDVQALKNVQLPIPLRVYTKEGQLIAEFGELRRDPVPLEKVPPLLIKALIATEDQRFFEHSGVDIYGLFRAAGQLAATGTKSQGGSTITMQVARDFYLTRKKTFLRKLTEIMLALKIERRLSKNEILELYLNKIYLGNRAYGVAAAAHVYFGKTLDKLTLPELATLAGLPKAPSTLNPIANPVASKERRDHVLERMYEQGYINKKQYDEAVKTPLNATFHGEVIPMHAPYVAEMVRNMMVTSFGDDAYTKGFNVYTTVTVPFQTAANKAHRDAIIGYDRRHGYRGPEGNLGIPDDKKLNTWVETLARIPDANTLKPAAVLDVDNNSITALLANGDQITIPWAGIIWAKPETKKGYAGATPRNAASVVDPGDLIRVMKNEDDKWELAQIPQVQGALVSMNPNNGAILGLVGGFDFQRSKYNRAVQMTRQPGSGFKPFIYSAALAKGFTLASVFDDSPISFFIPNQGVWAPQDDDHKFWGPMTLRVALAHSRNVVAVRVLQAIGVQYAIKYLTRFGFDPKILQPNLSLALGTCDVTPLEMVRGYSTFANGGYRVTPYIIDQITDAHGQLVYQSAPKVACTLCVTEDPPPAKPPTKDIKGEEFAPQGVPPQIAFLMTSALKSVILIGTGKAALSLHRSDLAGKTGTTSEQVDAWFNGFNSDVATTVWVGFDKPTPLHEYGAQAALPMWISFMGTVLAGTPEHTMAVPPGITVTNIDTYTGFRSSLGEPEYFRNDNMPNEEKQPIESGNGEMNNNENYPQATEQQMNDHYTPARNNDRNQDNYNMDQRNSDTYPPDNDNSYPNDSNDNSDYQDNDSLF